MKKMAPHIGNKRGSMLMLTLIVFMVILILGMTMITSMLYSQGENTMQINEQKAYYAALSAVEAVKSYFLNPKLDSSITSPHELVGDKEYTYNLKDQGIDEDTTVTIEITNKGPVPNESSKNYIVIRATGICQGEKSTIRARMIEEEQKGSLGGLYDSEVVFGTSNLQLDKDMPVIGNIFIDGGYAATINNLQMEESEDQKSTLYIKNKDSLQVATSKLTDVYIETESGATIRDNEANNIYIRCIGEKTNQEMQFLNNIVSGDAQLYLNHFLPNVNGNSVTNKFVFGFNRETLGGRWISNKKTGLFYIKGVGELSGEGSVSVASGGSVGTIYIDSNIKVMNGSGFKINPEDTGLEYESRNLSNFDSQEQYISNAISNLSAVEEVLKTKVAWDKEAIMNRYNEMSVEEEGVLQKDPANKYFDEYYDSDTNTRWIFPGYTPYGAPYTYTIKNGSNNNGDGTYDTYYISSNPMHKDDTIFFINNNGNNNEWRTILMNMDNNYSLENFHLYAPYFNVSFTSEFEYFSGSIISKSIYFSNGAPKKAEFKAPNKEIQITGAPSLDGDSNNSGNSNQTTYKYTFDSYIEKVAS